MNVELEPNSAEWVEMRRNYIGASDCPIIMGVSPWKNIRDLWNDKLGIGIEAPPNFYMKRGIQLEPVAREDYNKQKGSSSTPKQIFHPNISYMMANLDGLDERLATAVEIKCAGDKDHATAKSGKVPDKYYPQLQHQLAILDALNITDTIDYFSWTESDYVLVEVKKDDEYINKIYLEEAKFWDCVLNCTPPSIPSENYRIREDTPWENAVNRIKELEKHLEYLNDIKKEYEEVKKELISLCGNESTQGLGVTLKRSERKGYIDYSLIPELNGVDIELYRKKPSFMWTVKID